MTAPVRAVRIPIDGDTDIEDSERYLVALVETRLIEQYLDEGFLPGDYAVTVDSWYPDPDEYDAKLVGGLVILTQTGGSLDDEDLDFMATFQLACAAPTRAEAFALQRRVRRIFDEVNDNPTGFTDGVVAHDILADDGPRELPQDSLESREVLKQYVAHLRRPRWAV